MKAGRYLIPLAAALVVLGAAPAASQTLSLDLGEGSSATARIVQILLLLTVLSLAPSILVMMTSFTRIVVVLSFLRSALGLQQTPPNAVIIGLALFLTAFIMGPVFETSYNQGIAPLIENKISEEEAFDRSIAPLHGFMLGQVREQDLTLFLEIAEVEVLDAPEEVPLRILIPAFMITELRRAFEIGFLLFVPFLIIDMVVASVLMSMGMMMLPPVIISLPFKLVFFVLVDGWYLVAGSLVQSFGP
ncbi:MAG: flagellar type III secretion system pore protein FliP [Alphaproteobacteria bacterium]|jgi:flagellar biosynthetic protein FliP